MPPRIYILVMNGDNLVASFDGYKKNKNFRGLVNVFHSMGFQIKEVSEIEYNQVKEEAEVKEFKEISFE